MDIREGHPLYKTLYDIWVKQGRSRTGWVTKNGRQWRVHHPSDTEVFFTQDSGFDDNYGGQSNIPGA